MGKLLYFPNKKKDSSEEPPSSGEEVICELIHFEGKDAKQNKRAALVLHDLSARWAFVPFSDISSQIKSTYDIAKLGRLSLWVEIDNLTPQEQELIVAYLEEEHASDEPLILTTSNFDLNYLEESELNQDLVDYLAINTFEVDRAPQTQEGLKEILYLFFIGENE